jgi:hypothetical protein
MACDTCFRGFYEKDIALAKSTFDSWMPQIEGGSGSVFVVRICMMLKVGLKEIRTFVWVVIHVVGGTNGPPFGCLLWPLT